MPLRIQNYIWEQCYSSDDDNFIQTLIQCDAPIGPEDAEALVMMISENEQLMSELRYWMSTMRVAEIIGNGRINTAQRLRDAIEAESSTKSRHQGS
jgi:hypothetical protein